MTIDEKIELHQKLGQEIAEHFAKEDGVSHLTITAKIVPIDQVEANNYNPNKMPEKIMRMLWYCINRFGFVFPDLAWFDESKGKYIIIDGFHRYEALRRKKKKYISIVELKVSEYERMILTVLMNRIKGAHMVEKMSDLILKSTSLGIDDVEIAKDLGMEGEEYIRLNQQKGRAIAEYYRNHAYSKSWVYDGKDDND